MYIDSELVLSDAQAETTIAAHVSTNDIDFGAEWASLSPMNATKLELIIRVNEVPTSEGSATIAITATTDTDAAFGSAVTLFSLAATAYDNAAFATIGKDIVRMPLPALTERYLRVSYTIAVAELTAGKFDAFLVLAADSNILQ